MYSVTALGLYGVSAIDLSRLHFTYVRAQATDDPSSYPIYGITSIPNTDGGWT